MLIHAKMPEATLLALVVNEFLIRVELLPWDSEAAKAYAYFRTACEQEGKSLSAMDMLIAAQSVAVNATLISNDTAFYHVRYLLMLEDWAINLKRDTQ